MRLSEKEFKALCAKSSVLSAQMTSFGNVVTPKYRNVKVYIYPDSHISYGKRMPGKGKPTDVFDSIKEYDRWNELRLLEKAGKISGLQRQYKMVIQEKMVVNGVKIKEIAYKADFVYNEPSGQVIEDVKPFDAATQKYRTTKDFALKWKLLQVKFPKYSFRIY